MIITNFNKLLSFAFLIGCMCLASCGSDDEPTVDCSVSGLIVSVQNVDDASCVGAGAISVLGSGGEEPYEYSIDGAGFQSAAEFSNVASGSYTVTIRDANDCTATTQAVVGGDVSVIAVTTTLEDAGGCNGSDGQITVTAAGGDGNYEYSVDGGGFGSSNIFADLGHGAHAVEVRDGDGCSTTRSVNILSGISYSSSVQNIITSSCAIPGCHVAGTGRADFTNLATVQAQASGIKSRTQSGDMPRGGTITQEEKDNIACWVDDGAPNN